MAMAACARCGADNPADALFCAGCGVALRTSAQDPLLGKTIGGRYYLIERIGQGSAGTLYRAEHVTLRRKMAVKLLHPQLAQSDEAVERFRREAITVCEIDNDHIPQVHDFGRADDGRLFFAMEYLDGEPLSSLLEREGRLSPERAADILAQLADGLMEAHTLGYIHRDLRPRSVFLTKRRGRQDFVKILDFGLAKLVQPEVDAQRTAMGMTYGDPHFMSPEQARGETVDRRGDVYSLGALGFTMLTGEPPYKGAGTFDVLGKILDAPVPRVRDKRPECPPWLESVVRVALAKTPTERFQTVAELLEALERKQVLSSQPPTTPVQVPAAAQQKLAGLTQLSPAAAEASRASAAQPRQSQNVRAYVSMPGEKPLSVSISNPAHSPISGPPASGQVTQAMPTVAPPRAAEPAPTGRQTQAYPAIRQGRAATAQGLNEPFKPGRTTDELQLIAERVPAKPAAADKPAAAGKPAADKPAATSAPALSAKQAAAQILGKSVAASPGKSSPSLPALQPIIAPTTAGRGEPTPRTARVMLEKEALAWEEAAQPVLQAVEVDGDGESTANRRVASADTPVEPMVFEGPPIAEQAQALVEEAPPPKPVAPRASVPEMPAADRRSLSRPGIEAWERVPAPKSVPRAEPTPTPSSPPREAPKPSDPLLTAPKPALAARARRSEPEIALRPLGTPDSGRATVPFERPAPADLKPAAASRAPSSPGLPGAAAAAVTEPAPPATEAPAPHTETTSPLPKTAPLPPAAAADETIRVAKTSGAEPAVAAPLTGDETPLPSPAVLLDLLGDSAKTPADSPEAKWFASQAQDAGPDAFGSEDEDLQIKRGKLPRWVAMAGAAAAGVLVIGWLATRSPSQPAKTASSTEPAVSAPAVPSPPKPPEPVAPAPQPVAENTAPAGTPVAAPLSTAPEADKKPAGEAAPPAGAPQATPLPVATPVPPPPRAEPLAVPPPAPVEPKLAAVEKKQPIEPSLTPEKRPAPRPPEPVAAKPAPEPRPEPKPAPEKPARAAAEPAARKPAALPKPPAPSLDLKAPGTKVALAGSDKVLDELKAPTGPVPAAPEKKPSEGVGTLISLGRQKLDDGDADAAAASFGRAVELSPGNAEAVGGLGEASFEQGNMDQAARHLAKAAKLAPRKVGYQELLAQAQYKLGRYKEAADTCRKILKDSPNSAKAQKTLDLAEKKLASEG